MEKPTLDDLYFCDKCGGYFDLGDGEHINNVFTCHKCFHEKNSVFAQEENITKQDIEKDFLKLHIRNLRKSENLGSYEKELIYKIEKSLIDLGIFE